MRQRQYAVDNLSNFGAILYVVLGLEYADFYSDLQRGLKSRLAISKCVVHKGRIRQLPPELTRYFEFDRLRCTRIIHCAEEIDHGHFLYNVDLTGLRMESHD